MATTTPKSKRRPKQTVERTTKDCRVYKYVAKKPGLNRHLVADQIYRIHQHKKSLVEIEHVKRDAIVQLINQYCPGLEPAQATVAQLNSCIKELTDIIAQANSQARRRTGTAAQREQLSDWREQLADAKSVVRELRGQSYAHPGFKRAQAKQHQEYLASIRQLNAQSELYWPNYQAAWADIQAAAARARKEHTEINFPRWEGHGKVAVHFQPALAVTDLLGGSSNQARLSPVPDRLRNLHLPPRQGQLGDGWTLLQLRLGTQDSQPIWTEVLFRLDRPLPSDTKVAWIYLVRRRVGTHDKWSVQFVLTKETPFVREGQATTGSVGVDVGWRLFDHGLRVACWVGDDSSSGELLIPRNYLQRWAKVNKIQAQRDEDFNEAMARLGPWLESHRAGLPDWLAAETSHLGQWRNKRRLARLAILWREHRFSGDQEALDNLEAWRQRDRHLYNYQEGLRQRLQNWRQHLYRNFAAQLTSRYHTVVVEDLDWRKLQVRPGPEEADAKERARHYQRVACVSQLRSYLQHAAAKLVKEEAQWTTQRCHRCAEIEPFDKANEVYHICSHCAAVWDQDYSAATILLGLSQGTYEPAPAL